MSDLDIIRELKQDLGVKLPQLTDEDDWRDFGVKINGYLLNDNERVVGLTLHFLGLTKIPDSLVKLTSLQKLNLDNNQLSALPEAIGNLTSLQKLNLNDNRLSTLPEAIGNLTSLQKLNLDNNQLSALPEAIGNLTSLQKLNLNDNRLSTLPEAIGNLTSLHELHLNDNRLSTLPEAIGNLTSLQLLDLDSNQLSTLPEAIGNLTSLQKLDLDSNRLSPLPEAITNLTSLQQLYLGGNRLSTLPEAITNLSSLQDLGLGSNRLSALPEAITNLTSLQQLHLFNNRLSTLPEAITNLKSLQLLHLDSNRLSPLPEAITNLKSLQELHLFNNRLSALPEAIGNLTSLQKLGLGSNRILTLPEAIGNLKSLQELRLGSNQLSTLPETIGNLTSLQQLYLNDNRLSTLPETIGNLTSLQKLDLDSNQLSPLPEAITNLKSLRLLHLNSNRLSTLPEAITSLKSLQLLDLDSNQLSPLPEAITNLSSLQKLNLDSNRLSTLPEAITNLKSLQELHLKNNRIKEKKVIKQLLSISSLKYLYLLGNSIEDIPEKLLGVKLYDNCLTKLKDYFLAREPGTDQDYECKVIVIGNGGVGKSSLIRRMVENKFDENEESTHAIRLLRWSLSYNPASNCYLVNDEPPEGFIPLRLNIWDFGGQDLYHATHQLFMRTKALFLLVWDLKHEVEYKTTDAHDYTSINHPVQYWLDYCHTLGEDSPVIIGQNMFDSDEVSNFAGYDKLNRAYNIIRKDFHLNVKEMVNSDYSFKKFITTMTKTACEMTKEHSELPKAWITLREDIYKIREDEPDKKSLTMNEYLDLCDETGVTAIESETVANTVLDYFHNTGVLFYKKDLFEGKIIIDQQWAIEAVYTLFDRDKSYYRALKRSGGAFILSDLEIIDGEWKKRSLDEQKLLISYMESCELIFAYRMIVDYNGKEEWEYIIPQLLPDREARMDVINLAWSDEDRERAVHLCYRYSLLHCAVIYRLITRLGRLAVKSNSMWNSGLIFRDPETDGRVFVEANPEYNRIEIAISSKNEHSSQELLAKIKREFDTLNCYQKFEQLVSPDGVDYIKLDTLKMKVLEGATKIYITKEKSYPVADFHFFLQEKREGKENKKSLSDQAKGDNCYIQINNPNNCQIFGTVQNSELNYNKDEKSTNLDD